MAYCTGCGAAIADAARFCPKCGKQFNDSSTTKPAVVLTSPQPLRSSGLGTCRYHPQAGAAGTCVDCHNGFCQECAVPIVRHGTICLDCGAKFAQKKLIQAYIAVGLGFVAGIMIASSATTESWAFRILAPVIYAYFFPAVFFGWHYGGKIWKGLATMADGFSGTAGLVASIFLISFRLMVAAVLGVCGGGIMQYLSYRKIVNAQRALAAPLQTRTASA